MNKYFGSHQTEQPTAQKWGSQWLGKPPGPSATDVASGPISNANSLADKGRKGDDHVAHLSSGEAIIPSALLEQDPELAQRIAMSFMTLGLNPEQFIVGHPSMSINPETGLPEFGWFSNIWKGVKNTVNKVLDNPVLRTVAQVGSAFIPVVGPAISTAIGAYGGYRSGGILGGVVGGLAGYGTSVAANAGLGALRAGAGSLSLGNSIGTALSDAGATFASHSALGLPAGFLGSAIKAAGPLSLAMAGPPQSVGSQQPRFFGNNANASSAANPALVVPNLSAAPSRGAGAPPGSPHAPGGSPDFSFIRGSINRDTGRQEFEPVTPFGNTIQYGGRGGFGSSLFA